MDKIRYGLFDDEILDLLDGANIIVSTPDKTNIGASQAAIDRLDARLKEVDAKSRYPIVFIKPCMTIVNLTANKIELKVNLALKDYPVLKYADIAFYYHPKTHRLEFQDRRKYEQLDDVIYNHGFIQHWSDMADSQHYASYKWL